MPQPFEEKFADLQTMASNLVPKAANLAGLANPAFLAVSFTVDTLLKFIRLGKRIREAKREGIAKLDEKVRSEGIFRIPIPATVDLASLENFYLRRVRRLNQRAFQQFKEEITDALIARLDGTEHQLDMLKFARIIISGYDAKNKRWINPKLAEHFSEVDLDQDINYRLLTKELMLFCRREDISLEDLKSLIPQYLMIRVQAMEIDIQKLTQEEMESINEKITQFAFETFLGEDHLIDETAGFLINRKRAVMEEEIRKLERMLDAEPDESMDDEILADEKELIRKRIADLEKDMVALDQQRPTS